MENNAEILKEELGRRIQNLDMAIAMARASMQLLLELPIQDIESYILQRAEFKRVLAMVERRSQPCPPSLMGLLRTVE
jgi:hypothetical protein